jgi:hypothetical protein
VRWLALEAFASLTTLRREGYERGVVESQREFDCGAGSRLDSDHCVSDLQAQPSGKPGA